MTTITPEQVAEWFEQQSAALAPLVTTISFLIHRPQSYEFTISTDDMEVIRHGPDYTEVLARFREAVKEQGLPVADRIKALRSRADLLIAEARRLELRGV